MTMLETIQEQRGRKLPPRWRWVRLGEMCVEDRTVTDSDSSLPYLSLEDIEAETGRILNHRTGSEGEGTSNTFLFDERHVLYGKLRPYLNKVCLPSYPGRCTTEAIPLLPREGVDREFLAWVLRRDETVAHAMRGVTGSRMPRADMGQLMKLVVPLPPLDEQKRIAAILNEQMAAAERARKAAEERLAAAKALPAAFLREVFPRPGQPLPDGWRWVKVKDVVKVNPRRPTDLDRADDEPTSFVPMEAVDEITGAIAKTMTRPFGEIKKGYTYFAEGDVLFAKITPCMQNGKHAIARGLTDGIGFGTTEFHVLRPGPDVIAEWIHYFVRQPALLLKATEHFTGAVGQQRLPPDYLANLDFPLPPLDEQKHIVEVLNRQIAVAEKARAIAEEELKTINALPSALLRKAFAGDL